MTRKFNPQTTEVGIWRLRLSEAERQLDGQPPEDSKSTDASWHVSSD